MADDSTLMTDVVPLADPEDWRDRYETLHGFVVDGDTSSARDLVESIEAAARSDALREAADALVDPYRCALSRGPAHLFAERLREWAEQGNLPEQGGPR